MTRAGLDTSWYKEFCRGKADVFFEEFKWTGFDEFGELSTSSNFYKRFLGYEYILICHTDAFVFRDELEKWCQFGYDYIASVIYNPHWDGKRSGFHRLLGFTTLEYYGNGGFTLKKVETFYRITSKFRLFIYFYHLLRKIRKAGFLDDIFIAELFPSLSSSFHVAPKSLAQVRGCLRKMG